jgi:hypothetical protein
MKIIDKAPRDMTGSQINTRSALNYIFASVQAS